MALSPQQTAELRTIAAANAQGSGAPLNDPSGVLRFRGLVEYRVGTGWWLTPCGVDLLQRAHELAPVDSE